MVLQIQPTLWWQPQCWHPCSKSCAVRKEPCGGFNPRAHLSTGEPSEQPFLTILPWRILWNTFEGSGNPLLILTISTADSTLVWWSRGRMFLTQLFSLERIPPLQIAKRSLRVRGYSSERQKLQSLEDPRALWLRKAALREPQNIRVLHRNDVVDSTLIQNFSTEEPVWLYCLQIYLKELL